VDRKYFTEKKTGKRATGTHTVCCGQDKNRHILNKKKPYDWKLIEDYCENHLTYYPNCDSITPHCCKKCGRLIEYTTSLKDKTYGRSKKELVE
jgi:hypothetical protein|tara:strand:+ start:839 stop:1117 length:279 start_codon:yes stop_codon:yes gene_type:complete